MPKAFTEKNPFSKRVFSLEGALLKIEATGIFRPRYEAEVPLKGIRNEKDTAYIRTDSKTAIFGIPGVVLMLLVIFFSEGDFRKPLPDQRSLTQERGLSLRSGFFQNRSFPCILFFTALVS